MSVKEKLSQTKGDSFLIKEEVNNTPFMGELIETLNLDEIPNKIFPLSNNRFGVLNNDLLLYIYDAESEEDPIEIDLVNKLRDNSIKKNRKTNFKVVFHGAKGGKIALSFLNIEKNLFTFVVYDIDRDSVPFEQGKIKERVNSFWLDEDVLLLEINRKISIRLTNGSNLQTRFQRLDDKTHIVYASKLGNGNIFLINATGKVQFYDTDDDEGNYGVKPYYTTNITLDKNTKVEDIIMTSESNILYVNETESYSIDALKKETKVINNTSNFILKYAYPLDKKNAILVGIYPDNNFRLSIVVDDGDDVEFPSFRENILEDKINRVKFLGFLSNKEFVILVNNTVMVDDIDGNINLLIDKTINNNKDSFDVILTNKGKVIFLTNNIIEIYE